MAVLIEVDTPTELDAIEIEVNKQAASSAPGVPDGAGQTGDDGQGAARGDGPAGLGGRVADGELIITGITTDADGLGRGNIGGAGRETRQGITSATIGTINCAGNMTAEHHGAGAF